MKDIVIQKAQQCDFEGIYNLLDENLFECDENSVVKKVGIYKNIEEKDIPNMIVAKNGNCIVGALKVKKLQTIDDFKYYEVNKNQEAYTLERLCVKNEFRKNRIASKLIEYVLKNHKNCILCCDIMSEPVLNVASETLIKKFGFKYCKSMKWYDDRYPNNSNFIYKVYELQN